MARKFLVPADMGGQRITNAAPGVASTDVATVGQVGSGGGAAQNVFIQNAAPSGTPATYLWIQTGLGDGTDMTFWVEDGS